MAAGERTDPYLGFRFLVELDSLVVAGFASVSGLEVGLATEDYEEGGVNTHTHTLPKRFEYPDIVLERGLTDSSELLEWIQEVRDGTVRRRSGRIVLLDAAGAESWGWEFLDAYPVTWSGPELDADQSDVAIERLELTHRGLSKMEGLP